MALYSREISNLNALRTVNAKHKHMEMLLLDRLKENEVTYPDATKKSGGVPEEYGTTASLLPVEDEGDTRLSYDPNDPKYWLPPYEHGGVHAREQSRMVNSRRTPSGNFFNITNPSLHMDRVPSTNKPPPGYRVEIDTLVATKRANEIAEERAKRDAANAAIDAQIAAKKGETSDIPAWAGETNVH